MKDLFSCENYKNCTMRTMAQEPSCFLNGCSAFDVGLDRANLCFAHNDYGIGLDTCNFSDCCGKCKFYKRYSNLRQIAERLLFEYTICDNPEILNNRLLQNFHTFISVLTRSIQNLCYITFTERDRSNMYSWCCSFNKEETVAFLQFICNIPEVNNI